MDRWSNGRSISAAPECDRARDRELRVRSHDRPNRCASQPVPAEDLRRFPKAERSPDGGADSRCTRFTHRRLRPRWQAANELFTRPRGHCPHRPERRSGPQRAPEREHENDLWRCSRGHRAADGVSVAAQSATDPSPPAPSLARTARGLVLATHPGPTVAVVGYATATAAASHLGPRSVLLAFAVLFGQASVGWSNDWIDAPRDVARERRDKPIAAGLLARDVVGRGALIALTLCVPASFALGWRAGTAHLIAVAAAWSYNLGLKRSIISP